MMEMNLILRTIKRRNCTCHVYELNSVTDTQP